MTTRRVGLVVVVLLVSCVAGRFLGRAALRADDAPPAVPSTTPDPIEQLLGWAKKKPVPAPVWRDAALVEKRFGEAIEAVETAMGAKIDPRPTVRLSTRAEVGKIVAAELEQLPKVVRPAEASPLLLEAMSAALLAKYEIATRVVHVVPENVELATALLGVDLGAESVLRVVLVHECTHAFDFAHHALDEVRRGVASEAEVQALDAVVEGHAQFVAKAYATSSGQRDAFDRFTNAMGAVPEGAPEFLRDMIRASTADSTFAYFQGLAFFEAVAKDLGGEGVNRALDHPPRTTREIEHPSEWIHPVPVAAGLDVGPALRALEALIPSPPWIVSQSEVLEASVRSQFADLPPAEIAPVFEGFRDAKILLARGMGPSEMFGLASVQFVSPDQAKAYVAMDRRVSESTDARMKSGAVRVSAANYADGAGTGSVWPGTTLRKSLVAGPLTSPISAAFFSAGPFAFEVNVVGREVERGWIDRVVDALAAWATRPDHPLPAPAPADVLVIRPPSGIEFGPTTSVPMSVVGPDGVTVARARVSVMYATGPDSYRRTEGALENGACRIPSEAKQVTVVVYGARDATGASLNLGPSAPMDIQLDAKSLRIELPEGRSIEGRVVDGVGKGVPGVDVVATLVREDSGAGPSHEIELTKVRARDDGTYRLVGLGPRTRLECLPPAPFVAPPSMLLLGETTAPDWVVTTGRTAVVIVRDPAGKPVVGAHVQWARIERPDPASRTYRYPQEAVTTDDAGRVTLGPVPIGADLALSVSPSGDRLSRYDGDWDGQDAEVTLHADRRVVGRVVDPRGNPVTNVTVHLKTPGDERRKSVDGEGRFEFRDVPAGVASVGATLGDGRRHDRSPSKWYPVVEGAPVEVVIASGRIAVTVRGLASGRAILVRTSGSGESPASMTAAEGGVVTLDASALGTRVDVYVVPTSTDPRGLIAEAVEVPVAGLTLDLVAAMPSKGTIKASTPYEHLEAGLFTPWGVVPLVVAADGTFDVPPLPPATYAVRAKARGPTAWIYARAEFKPGATIDLELRPR